MANNVIKRIWNQNKMVNIEALQGMAFQAEDGGHTFEISGVDNAGTAVPLSGTVAGVFMRPDRADIALVGSASGGVVSVTLTDDCYAVPGRFGLTIFVTSGGQKTAVYAAVGTVAVTSGGAVAGDAPQDVVDLINAIDEAVASIPASYTGLIADIAPTYSSSAVYSVGAYVYYNGDLYRCTTPITTAETWTAAHWTAAVLGDDVGELKSAVFDNTKIIQKVASLDSWNISFRMDGAIKNKSLRKDGTIYNISGIEYKIFPYLGGTVTTECNDRGNGHLAFFDSTMTIIPNSGSAWWLPANIVCPEGTAYFGITLPITSGEATTINQTINLNQNVQIGHQSALASGSDLNNLPGNNFYLLTEENTYTNTPTGTSIGFLNSFTTGTWTLQIVYDFSGGKVYKRRGKTGGAWESWNAVGSAETIPSVMWARTSGLDTLDLNAVLDNGYYLLYDANNYLNKPDGFPNLGFLQVVFTGNWHIQLLYQFDGGTIYKRRGNADGSTWEQWRNITGGDTYNIENTYNFPEYSQTLSVTASPTITTSSNNYLASTNDTTDRTADILALLNTTGICNLGPGVFYVNGLQMPDNTSIAGSGNTTEIYMSGTADGFAIKLGSGCVLRDFKLTGSPSDLTFTDTEGGRHGILWVGDYTQHQTAPSRSIISNVYIRRFSGGGIRCYDTGYATVCCLEVSNVYIWGCWAGIDIPYFSEFHKFTNVRVNDCRIGCVNNGGNNIFVNCDFSSNKEIAMLMDNSQGQSPNNTHGSCIGCVFNHTSAGGVANAGIGIEILNCESGFVFTGCQIFFSQIHIVDSDGIVIADTNFGLNNCNVVIEGGGTVLFSNNMVQGTIPISVSDNPNVHFVNCYNRSTGAVWSN